MILLKMHDVVLAEFDLSEDGVVSNATFLQPDYLNVKLLFNLTNKGLTDYLQERRVDYHQTQRSVWLEQGLSVYDEYRQTMLFNGNDGIWLDFPENNDANSEEDAYSSDLKFDEVYEQMVAKMKNRSVGEKGRYLDLYNVLLGRTLHAEFPYAFAPIGKQNKYVQNGRVYKQDKVGGEALNEFFIGCFAHARKNKGVSCLVHQLYDLNTCSSVHQGSMRQFISLFDMVVEKIMLNVDNDYFAVSMQILKESPELSLASRRELLFSYWYHENLKQLSVVAQINSLAFWVNSVYGVPVEGMRDYLNTVILLDTMFDNKGRSFKDLGVFYDYIDQKCVVANIMDFGDALGLTPEGSIYWTGREWEDMKVYAQQLPLPEIDWHIFHETLRLWSGGQLLIYTEQYKRFIEALEVDYGKILG